MARNIPRMVGMAALLLLLSGTATATSYPSADQYSLRNHYRITRRSAGHEILPSVSTDYDEDEERQRQAVSLTELLELWEPQHREEERRPQRGDIEVTTKGVERGDVPVIGKRRKLVRRQAPVQMWGFAEDDGMLPSDEEARPTPHPHRKHHRNSGVVETEGGNGPMRWRGPEEEMRQRPGLKDRRRYNSQPNDRQRYDEEARRRQEEEQKQRLYEMRRTPEELQRRDNPAQPDAGNENEMRRRQEAAYDLRRRQEEQQRRENPRQNENDRRKTPDNREEEMRRRQEEEERRRAYEARRREENLRQQPDNREDETRQRQEEEERRRAYEARRREENPRQNENDRRKQPDNREDETRQRPEEEERRRAYEARRREEEQRQRGRNPPADAEDTYEKRMQEWRKKKEEHDRLVREREQQRQQHHPQQDPQRPGPQAQTKSQEELENERKLQEYIRRNTPIAVPPSGNRDPASDRIRENEQVRRAEHERRLEEERRRKQVQEESRRLAEEERMRRTHEGEDAGRNRTKHRGTSSVRPRWPINTAVTSRTPVESYSSSRRPIPQNRPEENDGRYLESRRNEAAAAGSNSRRPSSEAEEEEERLKRLKGLPVSATIIVRSTDTGANRTSTPPPALNLRFGEEIDFPGFSPNRRGPEASRFPAPVTKRPPVPSPQPCVWAIVVCCQQHRQQDANQAMRITRCFEATNCPGASWDVDRRCSEPNVRAANEEIREFYLKGMERNY